MNLEDLFYGEFKLQKLYTRDSICNRQCSYKVINLRMTQKKKKIKSYYNFQILKIKSPANIQTKKNISGIERKKFNLPKIYIHDINARKQWDVHRDFMKKHGIGRLGQKSTNTK